jgi:hypothetical protein
MTTALLESRILLFAGRGCARAPGAGGVTLEERLEAVWRAVRAEGRAECPVCHSVMRPDGGAARCAGCGSTLS